jgi:hypothetical protein
MPRTHKSDDGMGRGGLDGTLAESQESGEGIGRARALLVFGAESDLHNAARSPPRAPFIPP